jgi:NAD(P)-dependent dehydrogenase (short-subunit alcohol dehydrogenase family)
MGELDGRIAVITGAGRGIGWGIAQRLGRAGAVIVIAEFNETLGREAETSLSADGLEAVYFPVDVRSEDSVAALAAAVKGRFGRVDILVNNAGLAQLGKTEEFPLSEWNLQIDVMLTGVFLCTRSFGAIMLEQGKGVVLNISSIGGMGGWPLRTAYDAAKAGVISFTENVGTEWARRGVRVVSIAPGVTRTSMLQQMVAEGRATLEKYNTRTPMGRTAEVEEIAAVAQFLVSDRASYITATTVTVDGGWTAWGILPLT